MPDRFYEFDTENAPEYQIQKQSVSDVSKAATRHERESDT